MARETILVTHNINIVNGGLTNAIYSRANMLTEEGKSVSLLTLGYHSRFDSLLDYQYKHGKISKNVKVYNIFEELDPKKNLPKVPKKKLSKIFSNKKYLDESYVEPGYIRYRDKKNPKAYRYFKNGIYCTYRVFDKSGRIEKIDYFSPEWKRLKQEIYDEYGNIRLVRYMDRDTNKPKLETYLSRDGEAYLTISRNLKNGKEQVIFLHYPTPIEFSNLDEFLTYCLQKFINKHKKVNLFCEKREYVKWYKNLKHNDCNKYYVLHNTHLGYPHTLEAPIDPTCNDLFDNLDIFKYIIVLTDEQKYDIAERIGSTENFISIPNVVQKSKVSGDIQKKENLVVSISRLEGVKNLEHAIKAFRKVVDNIPNAQYHIYGYGSLEGNLKKQILELGLENNVFIKGFCENSQIKFSEAVCSVMTSKYEGFPLVVGESMSVGTPVVSYKTKYGLKEQIRHDIDGYLVEWGDIDSLAEHIIKLLSDDGIKERMSKACMEITDRFSYDKIKQKWLDIL